jgi:hypothetical protein
MECQDAEPAAAARPGDFRNCVIVCNVPTKNRYRPTPATIHFPRNPDRR